MIQVIIQTTILATIAYSLTLASSRILGRKLISQMTFFDFVIGIILGSATVNASVVRGNTSLSGFVIIIVTVTITLILDFAHLKSVLIRKKIGLEPVVVIEGGQIVNGNMKKIRLSIEELMMKLREKNFFNIADVEIAIMEIDGKLSVQPNPQNRPLTPLDMNIPTIYKGLTRDLIIDGKILEENLNYISLSEVWLKDQIRGYGIEDIKDVFYAGIDSTRNLYVSRRQKGIEEQGKYGIE